MFGEVQRQAFAHSERSGKIYKSLLLYLTVAWVCYPIVWIIGGTGYAAISANSEAAAYAILDVSAKGVFGILTLVLLKSLKEKVGPSRKTSTVDASGN